MGPRTHRKNVRWSSTVCHELWVVNKYCVKSLNGDLCLTFSLCGCVYYYRMAMGHNDAVLTLSLQCDSALMLCWTVVVWCISLSKFNWIRWEIQNIVWSNSDISFAALVRVATISYWMMMAPTAATKRSFRPTIALSRLPQWRDGPLLTPKWSPLPFHRIAWQAPTSCQAIKTQK